ncbi:NAD(P)-binding domain-containing protein [Nanoarchaeota archaeon]
MKIGFIGLGRMGKNMVLNLLDKGNKVVVHNRSPEPVRELSRRGAIASYSISELISKLPTRKVVWIMIKSGKPVDDMIKKVLPFLKRGDLIIDGGNSWFKDSIRRYEYLKGKGINFLDCGTSGGMGGARHGACMMVGGDKRVFSKVEGLFRDMCVKEGYGLMGGPGAGHLISLIFSS